jgi:hypothetical protein
MILKDISDLNCQQNNCKHICACAELFHGKQKRLLKPPETDVSEFF